MRCPSVVFPSVALIVACSAPGPQPIDAGHHSHLAEPDASTPDAGQPDAGTPDAGAPDAGAPDAGVDAGLVALTWAAAPTTPGSPRWGAPLAQGQGRFFLFGGNTYPAGGTVGDTLAFSPDGGWSSPAVHGEVPSPRYCHCTAFLPAQGQVLLVGGRNDNGALAPGAWTLDVTTLEWKSVAAPLPEGTIGCAVEWMPRLSGGRAVVFGGDGLRGMTADTWSYDPTARRFTRLTPPTSPPARRDPASTYDEATGMMMVWGGAARLGAPGTYLNDFWVFDGADWSMLVTNAPPSARRFPAEGYDPARRHWYVFSGTDDVVDFQDLWRFDFSAQRWTKLEPTGPSPGKRGFSSSEFHPSGALYVFGGLLRQNFTAATDAWRLEQK